MSENRCCPAEQDLQSFIVDANSVAPTTQRHIANCPTCQSRLAATRSNVQPTASTTHVDSQAAVDTLASTGRFSSPVLALPTTLGKFQVVEELGRGGMGCVYRAIDTMLDRGVALKLLPPEFAADKDLLERFRREAQAAAQLDHPGICPVYEFGDIEGKQFICMKLLIGKPLSTFIGRDQPLSVSQVLGTIRAIAVAAEQAHSAGILHRDLKPANIMIVRGGKPVVMDFGLAGYQRSVQGEELTHVGEILGTPAYMSPEQARMREQLQPATDVFSLGAVMYEMLAGARAFRGSGLEIVSSVLRDDPPDLTSVRDDIPPAVAWLCSDMLQKDVGDRIPSMSDVVSRIDNLKSRTLESAQLPVPPVIEVQPPEEPASQSRSRRPSMRIVGAVVAAVSLLLITVVVLNSGSPGKTVDTKQSQLPSKDRDVAADPPVAQEDSKPKLPLLGFGELAESVIDEGKPFVTAVPLSRPTTADEQYEIRLVDGPTGLTVTDGAINWTPSEAQGPDQHSVHLQLLVDSKPVDVLTFGIDVNEVNQPPKLGDFKPAIAVAGKVVDVPFNLSDADVPEQVFTWRAKAPPGVRVTRYSAGLRLTVSSNVPGGSHRVTVSATDSMGATSTQALPLFVRNARKIAYPMAADDLQEVQKEWADALGLPVELKEHGLTFRLVPPGSFTMGTSSWSSKGSVGNSFSFGSKPPPEIQEQINEFERSIKAQRIASDTSDERPRKVVLTKPFYISSTEVTREAWQNVSKSRPWIKWDKRKDPQLPVTGVTWRSAEGFCERLAGEPATGVRYRLPTEAEWEYACRGGSDGDYCFNTKSPLKLGQFAWYSEAGKPVERTGQLQPNGLGLRDMHGNALEWCLDHYTAEPHQLPGTDPTGPTNGKLMVARGGSIKEGRSAQRCSARRGLKGTDKHEDVSFRVVREVPDENLARVKEMLVGQ